MKKTIAILLVLVLAGVGLFAANNATADLELNTSVAGRYEIKVSSAAVTGATLGARLTSFAGLVAVSSVTFTEQDLTETLNVSYLTNQKIKATVTVAAWPMKSETQGVDTEIGYNVTVGTNAAIPVAKEIANAVEITLYDEGSVTNGMRVISQSFKVDMIEDDWTAATADTTYKTDWTITLATL